MPDVASRSTIRSRIRSGVSPARAWPAPCVRSRRSISACCRASPSGALGGRTGSARFGCAATIGLPGRAVFAATVFGMSTIHVFRGGRSAGGDVMSDADPAPHVVELVDVREVDLQRRDGDLSFADRVEVGPGARVARGARRRRSSRWSRRADSPCAWTGSDGCRLPSRVTTIGASSTFARDSGMLTFSRNGPAAPRDMTSRDDPLRDARGASRCVQSRSTSENANDGTPNRKPSIAAATVPE